MNESTIQNSVRYVVSSKHAGGILPGSKSEMWRDIYVEPGANISGGILGNNINVTGNGILVKGAVYARGGIKITSMPGEKLPDDTIEFSSVVTASESLLIEDHFPSRTKFYADIFAGQVNITNAFVRGNIYAKRAIIKNSIVLGGVFCREKLTLQNTSLSTFRASKVNLQPEILLFYPFALAEEPIKLGFQAKSLSFANLMELAKKKPKNETTEVVFMSQEDVVKVNEIEGNTPKEFYMMSLGSRILDLEDLKNAFLTNKKYLEVISLGSHLKPDTKHNFNRFDLANLENVLFDMLKHPPQKEVVRKTTIDKVAERDAVKKFMNEIGIKS